SGRVNLSADVSKVRVSVEGAGAPHRHVSTVNAAIDAGVRRNRNSSTETDDGFTTVSGTVAVQCFVKRINQCILSSFQSAVDNVEHLVSALVSTDFLTGQ